MYCVCHTLSQSKDLPMLIYISRQGQYNIPAIDHLERNFTEKFKIDLNYYKWPIKYVYVGEMIRRLTRHCLAVISSPPVPISTTGTTRSFSTTIKTLIFFQYLVIMGKLLQ
jgi:hypothetical protein